MPYVPRGVAEREELAKALDGLPPWPAYAEVVTWDYKIDENWAGEPALYFLIVLRDEAATDERLREVTRRIRNFVDDKADPQGQWDLFPYFRFISQSEYEQELTSSVNH